MFQRTATATTATTAATTGRVLVAAITAVTLLTLAACGSGDGSDADTDAEPAVTVTEPTATATMGDGITDSTGDEEATLDDAIASLPTETVWGVVADQLGADDLSIDGSQIRLSLEQRSVSDAVFDCIVAGSFIEDGQSVTMSYPDGDVTCGE